MREFGWFLILTVLAYVVWRLATRDERAERDVVLSRSDTYDSTERSFMPREIAHGELVASETYYQTRVPRRLGARVDQVYATPEGFLVPVETKRRYRHRVTNYDVIELSAQASVLRNARPHALRQYEVAHWGWVRFAAPGRRPTYLRTNLLTDDQLAALHDRYENLMEGNVEPNGPEHAAICRKCAYLSRCPRSLVKA